MGFPSCKLCGKEIEHRFPSQVQDRLFCSLTCYNKHRRGRQRKEKRKADSPLYRVWSGMVRRCLDQKSKDYHRYGGRGITVCPEWLHNFWSFHDWAVNKGHHKGLTIERVNNEEGYHPENCRFASPREQARNRRGQPLIEAFGEFKKLTEWAEDPRCVVSKHALWARLRKQNMPPEKAITAPLIPRNLRRGKALHNP